MLQPITHPDGFLVPTRAPCVPVIASAIRGWLLRCWASQCRFAERPERFVPRC